MLDELRDRLKEQERLITEYNTVSEKYFRLAVNLHQALIEFLSNASIDVLDVQHRVKKFDSFYEKVQRKGYVKPFEEMEDICGLRIICYYPSDLDKISELIKNEFEVLESTDKADLLEPDRFGYRSLHFIIVVKREWLNAPNYRGLDGLKAEIQVRTILMHAWADVEHKLAYKRKEHVPPQLRRRLSQLSALFEVADQHLDSLREEREEYKQLLTHDKKRRVVVFDASKGLNVDNLQAVLDYHFPDRQRVEQDTPKLLDEMLEHGITIEAFEDGYFRVKDILLQSEKELFSLDEDMLPEQENRMSQTGIVRHILDLTHDTYWRARKNKVPPHVVENVRKWKAVISKKQA
jgi:putative GTP pyrophosphokinase